MENEEKKNTENEFLGNQLKHDNVSETNAAHSTDNSGGNKLNDNKDAEGNPNKYLAMEQPGVSYTKDHNPISDSDRVNPDENNRSDKWNDMGGNSEYADAFNQDDYILNDNVDLDEDQNKSISSDDEDFEESNERYTN